MFNASTVRLQQKFARGSSIVDSRHTPQLLEGSPLMLSICLPAIPGFLKFGGNKAPEDMLTTSFSPTFRPSPRQRYLAQAKECRVKYFLWSMFQAHGVLY